MPLTTWAQAVYKDFETPTGSRILLRCTSQGLFEGSVVWTDKAGRQHAKKSVKWKTTKPKSYTLSAPAKLYTGRVAVVAKKADDPTPACGLYVQRRGGNKKLLKEETVGSLSAPPPPTPTPAPQGPESLVAVQPAPQQISPETNPAPAPSKPSGVPEPEVLLLPTPTPPSVLPEPEVLKIAPPPSSVSPAPDPFASTPAPASAPVPEPKKQEAIVEEQPPVEDQPQTIVIAAPENRQCESEAVDLTSSVQKVILSDKSELDRRTRNLVSTTQISLKNISPEALLAPLSLRVLLSFPSQVNAGPVVLNGVAMVGTPPGDLQLDIPLTNPSLAAGASLVQSLVFSRASSVRFTYEVQVLGRCPSEASSGPPVIVVEQDAYEVEAGRELQFQVSATDPDNDRVSLTGGPKLPNAIFQATNGVNPSGMFKFSPGAGQGGQFDVNFVARDAQGLSSSKVVRIAVTKINRAPEVSGPPTSQVQVGSVLQLPITVSDPDGDVTTVRTSNLPENGVFIEASRSFTFIPTDSQVGTFQPTFVANDGNLDSAEYRPLITVLPRSQGGGGEPSHLDLQVDPVSNPALGANARITGAVNSQAGTPPAQPSFKLINSLVPSTGEQGKSLTVQLAATGSNFTDGVSAITFGDGIAVNSFTINSKSTATAQIKISSTASLGPRNVQITTGDEKAISVVAFNVIPGKTTLRGKLKDPETGNPIAGARITIEGTSLTVISGLDGSFEFFDAPSGSQTLIVNALNRELQRITVDSESGETIELGEFGSPSLVFDPAAPPTASVGSVLGRGAADPTARLTFEQAKQIVIDAILATGGDEGGALDEFGNQLNPQVTGNGLISAPNELVEDQAYRLLKGETRPLYEYLLGFSFGFDWESGKRPSLLKWINALQDLVNVAWQEPNKLENRIVILIFSQGRTISPVPPTITFESRLTASQAYLLTSSWLAFSAKVAPQFAGNSIFDRWGEFLVPSANAQVQPPVSPLTQFWNYVNTKDFQDAYKGKVVDAFGGAFGNAVLNSIGKEASIPGSADISSAIVGGFTDVLTTYLVKLNLLALTPRAPIILDAEKITEKFASGDEFDTAVILRTTRTFGDQGLANPPNKRFIYRLWRKNPDGTFTPISGGVIPERRKDTDPTKGPFLDPADPTKFIFIDYAPVEGHSLYYVDVERAIGENPDNPPPDLPIWTKFLPQPSFGINGWGMLGSFNPVGALTAIMGPMVSIANGIRKMSSPMSNPKAVWVGKSIRAGTVAARGMEINPYLKQVFVSYPSQSRVDVLNLDTLKTVTSFDPGFKAPPGQSGLAINFKGDLFSENAASDESFGGKIFKYANGSYAREHVGMTNYFSFPLGYARPVSVPAMAIAPDQNLFVVDGVDQQIKKVGITATYDPYRRVGQPVLSSPLFTGLGGPNTDIAADFSDHVFVTKDGNVLVGDLKANTVDALFDSGAVPFQTARSVAIDAQHNLYISGQAFEINGVGTTQGIAILPPVEQQVWSQRLDPNNCRFDRHLVLRGLRNVGLVRVHPQGRTMVFLDDGVPRFQGFGLSGQIFDKDGNRVSGALVSVGGKDFPSSPPVKTNACGTFHLMNLVDPAQGSRIIEVTVSHPTIGTQKMLVGLDSFGQTFRDFVLNPPDIQDNDPPTKKIDPPDPIVVEVTPTPDPPIIPIDVEVEPPPVKSEETPFSAQTITIISPVDFQKTSATTGVVKGYIDDDQVTEVFVAANGVEQQVPVINQRFTANVNYGTGLNYIVARAAITDDDKPATEYSPTVRVIVDPTLTGTGSISGQIVDQTSGRPVAGVTIKLAVTGDVTLTDAHGVFEFNDVPLGQTTVEIVIPDGDPDQAVTP